MTKTTNAVQATAKHKPSNLMEHYDCDEDGPDSCAQDDETRLLQTSLRASSPITKVAHLADHHRSQIVVGLAKSNRSAALPKWELPPTWMIPPKIIPVKESVDHEMVVTLVAIAGLVTLAYKLSVSDFTLEPRKSGLYAKGELLDNAGPGCTNISWCMLALLTLALGTFGAIVFFRIPLRLPRHVFYYLVDRTRDEEQLLVFAPEVRGIAYTLSFSPLGLIMVFVASLGVLTNPRISKLSKKAWRLMLATCWAFVIIAGVAFSRATLHCGVIFCVGQQPYETPFAGLGLVLIFVGIVFFVGTFMMRPSMKQTKVWVAYDMRMRLRKAAELHCGLCLSLLVLPILFLLTTILPPAFHDLAPATISANLALSSQTAEYDDAWLVSRDVRLSDNVLLNFFPDTVIFYLFLELLAITAVAANIFPSFGRYLNQKQDPMGFTNGEKIAIALFGIMLFLFVRYWLLDHSYHSGQETIDLWWWERISRTWGQTAVLLMSLLILPASKNSLWLKSMGISWERSLWLHRKLGYACLMCIAGHILSMWARFAELRSFPHDAFAFILYYPINNATLTRSETPEYGNWTIGMIQMIGYPAFFMIGIGAVIRHKNWELFKYFHFVYLALLPAVILHASAAWFFMLGGMAFGIVDAAIRFATVVTPPACLLENGIVMHTAEGGFTELHMNWTHAEPGQFAWLNVPCISTWEWHPFSLSSGIDDGYAQMCIKNMGPGTWTDKLYQLGKEANHSSTMFDIQVDGPYGPYLEMDTHGACLLIAGGIGITQVHSIFRSVAQLIKRKEPFQPQLKSVHLVWIGKTIEIFKLFGESVKNCVSCSTDGVKLRASFFQTQRPYANENDLSLFLSTGTFSPEIRFLFGRPNFAQLYVDEARLLGGKSLLVQACGPEAMIEAAAEGARGNDQVVFESMLFTF